MHPISPRQVYEILRPYQQEGVDFLRVRRRAFNYDDMGLGKTVTTLTALEWRHEGYSSKNFLIACPTNALYVWEYQIREWYGKESIVYAGNPKQRAKLWDKFLEGKVDYLITNYSFLKEIEEQTLRDKKSPRFDTTKKETTCYWSGIVADEIQMPWLGLFNHKTDTYKELIAMRNIAFSGYLLTGTPIRKGVTDTYAQLHFANDQEFKSYWGFVKRFCVTIKERFGTSIERNPADVAAFRAVMRRFMIRRMKTEVLGQLPGKQRQPWFVKMNETQQKVYDQLVDDLMAEHDGNYILAAGAISRDLRLRQLLVCPRILGIDDSGEALVQVAEMTMDMLRDNRPVTIFTPFKMAVPFIEQELLAYDEKVKVYKLHGGMTPVAFASQWQEFAKPHNKNKVLICVIQSGASFSATESADAFFLGYDWDFTLNDQAEDRLNRSGQENFVNIRYMMHKGTIDEDVARTLNDKTLSSTWIVGTDSQYVQQLKEFKGKRD